MAFSQKTINLDLPQWVDDDKPTWLGDLNIAFARVDNAYGALGTRIDTFNSNILALQNRIAALENRVSTLENGN